MIEISPRPERSAQREVEGHSHRARWLLLRLVLLAALAIAPVTVHALDLDGKLVQGGLVLGTSVPGASVTLDGRAVPVTPDGRFVFGFGRESYEERSLSAGQTPLPEIGEDIGRLPERERKRVALL